MAHYRSNACDHRLERRVSRVSFLAKNETRLASNETRL